MSDFDEPEPDIVLADLRKFDGKRHPRAQETLLVVEVADTSLRFGRNERLALYAEAGIQEVWIVNLINNIIEVYREPTVGLYQKAKIFKRGETLASNILPGLAISVDSLVD